MDLEHADFALLIGTNPAISRGTYSQLTGGTMAYDRFVRRGGRAVFVDPRRTESADRWGGHLAIRPGADVYLLLALLHELRDMYAPSPSVDGIERLLRLSAEYPAARAARLTGISIERIRDLADAIRTAKRATFFVSVGVSQGPFGTLCAVAIQALAYVTGNFDREGGLLFQPWSAALGTLARFPRQPSRVGAYTANAGGLPGGILADEILTPGPERIRALIVMSGNPLTSMPDETRLQEAFRHLDLLVTIDMYTNETGREAHLVLPATSWLERADLAAWNAAFVQESFIDSTPAMRPPPGEARPEWRIFADLSLAAGRPLLGWATRPACKVPFDRMVQPLANLIALPFRRMMPSVQGVPWRRPRGGTYLRGRRRVRFWSAELESEPHRLETHATELITAAPSRRFVLHPVVPPPALRAKQLDPRRDEERRQRSIRVTVSGRHEAARSRTRRLDRTPICRRCDPDPCARERGRHGRHRGRAPRVARNERQYPDRQRSLTHRAVERHAPHERSSCRAQKIAPERPLNGSPRVTVRTSD